MPPTELNEWIDSEIGDSLRLAYGSDDSQIEVFVLD
jgi:hypothetical protein